MCFKRSGVKRPEAQSPGAQFAHRASPSSALQMPHCVANTVEKAPSGTAGLDGKHAFRKMVQGCDSRFRVLS